MQQKEGPPPSAEELRAWLRLAHTDGIGPIRGRALLQCLGPPQDILDAGPGQVAEILQSTQLAHALFQPDAVREAAISQALQWLRSGGHDARDWAGSAIPRHILLLHQPAYPPRLLDLADPPLLLYCAGDPAWLSRHQIGIVGSRNATAIGARTAWEFGGSLAAAGCTVVSGLAEGIDRAAHEGALATPGGGTVAVLGTGIDRIYPSRHRRLAQRMAAQGALISEQPIGMPPLQANFPRRNRLIAALASGVLVVEANPRSGSLITARLAAELGREVMAVPGSIHSPLARGCNSLIRQGAKLVESAEDVLTEIPDFGSLGLRSVPGPGRTPPAPTADPGPDTEAGEGINRATGSCSEAGSGNAILPDEQARMLTAMSADPVMLETLAAQQGLSPSRALAALQMLELDGLVQRQLDGSYVRCPSSCCPSSVTPGRSFGFFPKPVP